MPEESKSSVLKVKLIKDQAKFDILHSDAPSPTDPSWQGYVMKLSTILSENNISPEFRSIAATKLQNALSAKDGGVLQMKYDYRWLSFNKNIRQHIKDNILKSLGTDTVNPSPAALCVVSIAAAEFPNGQWPDLMNSLIRNIVDGSSSETVKEASFQTITYLCLELGNDGRHILLKNAHAIHKAILLGMKDANPKVVIAAINALENAADLFSAIFEVMSEKQLLMQMLYDATEVNDVDVRAAVIQCLKSLVSCHYQSLEDCIDPVFFEIAVDCLKSDTKALRFKAIDFFKEVCYVEDELRQKAIANGDEFYENRFYTPKSLAFLLPTFMELLTIYMVDENSIQGENEMWNKYLGFLKELTICCGHSNVDQCIMNFIRDNIISSEWQNRKAALTAFNTIATDSGNSFEPLVLPLIQIMVEDENVEVRATAAQAVSEMCNNVLQKEQYQDVLLPALLDALHDEISVATIVCNAISYLAHAGKWNQPRYFVTVVHLLLEMISRSEVDNRLQWEAAYTLHFIVGKNQTKCYYAAHKTALKIIPIIQRLSGTELCHESLSILHITLETFLKRLPLKIASQISDMVMQSLAELIKNKLEMLLEINLLPLISTLIKNSGCYFRNYIEEFKVYLLAVIEKDKEPNIAGIRLIRDLSQVVGDGILPHCEEIVPLLLSNLRGNDANRALKKEILLALTFIILAIGENFDDFLENTIYTLTSIQDRMDTVHITNLNLHNLVEMHKHLLKPYRAIVHVFKNDKKKSAAIMKKLEPSLVNIIEIITKITKKQNPQLDVYLSLCVEEMYDICCIIDSTRLKLIDSRSITLLLSLGAQSSSSDTKAITSLIKKKIAFFKNPRRKSAPASLDQPGNTKKIKNLLHRGFNYILMVCRCVKLFPKR